MINRDIKPGNLLIGRSKELLLSDMGGMRSAASSDASTISLQGTRGFLAPEMIEGKGHHGCACDMWSAGCVAVLLGDTSRERLGKVPFPDLGEQQLHEVRCCRCGHVTVYKEEGLYTRGSVPVPRFLCCLSSNSSAAPAACGGFWCTYMASYSHISAAV